jgi:hypothetical protein
MQHDDRPAHHVKHWIKACLMPLFRIFIWYEDQLTEEKYQCLTQNIEACMIALCLVIFDWHADELNKENNSGSKPQHTTTSHCLKG